MAVRGKRTAGLAATALAAALIVGCAGTAAAAPTGYPPEHREMSSMQSRPHLPTLEGGSYAVDGNDLYVADFEYHRAIRIVPGVEEPITLPFAGLHSPSGIAVENGNVYVSDTGNNRVLALLSGQSTPVELPFDGLSGPRAIAVENGNVYVVDYGHRRILVLRSGESAPTVLPFGALELGGALAVDDGDVYTTDSSAKRVNKLASGAITPTVLPFEANHQIARLTVDNGDVYFFDFDQSWMSVPFGSLGQEPAMDAIRKVTAGTSTPVTLRFDTFRDPAVLHIENGEGYLVDGVQARVPTPLTIASSPAAGTGSLGLLLGS